MAAVWLRFRAELRTRWRALLAVALLAGIAGGATLAAVAGARRTDSAFSRLLVDTEAWDVLVNPDRGNDSAVDWRKVAALPQVADADRADGLFVAPLNSRGEPDLEGFGIALASRDGLGYAFGRQNVIEGRMPGRRRAREILIDPELADRRYLGVGDRIASVAFSDADLARLESGAGFAAVLLVTLALAAVPAWRYSRVRETTDAGGTSRRPSRTLVSPSRRPSACAWRSSDLRSC